MRIFDKVLIFLKLRKPPKFKVGDWIRDSRLSYYKQICEITEITSDIMYKEWGYSYKVKSYMGNNADNPEDFDKDDVYQYVAERIEPRFFERPYDPKQMGDKEDDI